MGMNPLDTTSCGPCANVMCSQYGCQRQRRVIADYLHPHCSAVIVPQGCNLPAHQRTDLPEPGLPEKAAHIHPKMLLIELTLTHGFRT